MNAKRKGNAGEHKLAHWLESKGIKAFRNSMSGGSIWKGDIANNLDLTIEVKTCKKINLLQCWKQVERDASTAHNSPLLAVHFDGMPDNEWLMVIHSEDWIEMIKKTSTSPITPEITSTREENPSYDRSDLWAIQNATRAFKGLEKVINKQLNG